MQNKDFFRNFAKIIHLNFFMIRTFHAKTPATSWTLLVVLAFVAGYAAWRKEAVMLALALVVVTIIIDRIIHTEYSIDNGTLTIRKGRFSKPHFINIGEIQRIDQASGMRIGGKPVGTFLILILSENRELTVCPKDETEFIKQIHKQRHRNENE